jgi:cardiolipin synthase (CMP-forming)
MSVDRPSSDPSAAAGTEPADVVRGPLTIPNVVTAVRLVGTAGLVVLALKGHASAFAVLFLVLALTDWIDGRLARWLHQRSDWGARLDSMADALLFAVLLFGVLRLKNEQILANRWWIALAILSYTLTCAAGLWKFGRLPAYHTWSAKISWHLVLVAVLFLFFDWSIWPLRIAMLGVTLTNLEATLMTHTLDNWHADVRSLRDARRLQAGKENSAGDTADKAGNRQTAET